MGRRRRRRSAGPFGFLVLLVLGLAAASYLALRPDVPAVASIGPPGGGVLRVHYVDVGQGDGTIWELPDGSLVVYDCGPPAADAQTNPMTRYLRDVLGRPAGSPIHALFASHGHLDHAGGCEEVFAEHPIAHVYEAWYEGDDAPQSYRRHLVAIEAEGAQVHRLPQLAPGPLALPSVGAELLWPRAFAPGGWDAIAEASLVVRLQHGATSFCFQGDIEDRQEKAIVEQGRLARCDVLLVGHHGSRHASSAGWLGQMGPDVAVVSSGDNAYGHPTPEALCRVRQAGATLYLTSQTGSIVVESDGASVRVVQGEAHPGDPCAAPVTTGNATAPDDS